MLLSENYSVYCRILLNNLGGFFRDPIYLMALTISSSGNISCQEMPPIFIANMSLLQQPNLCGITTEVVSILLSRLILGGQRSSRRNTATNSSKPFSVSL